MTSVLLGKQRELFHIIEKPEEGPLPEVPQSVLHRALNHLTGDELALALRERLVPMAWLPHVTLYAEAGQRSHPHVEPRAKVIARIAPRAFTEAVRRLLGSGLVNQACDGLKRKLPEFSAHQRLTSRQQFFFMLVMLGWVVLWPVVPLYLYKDLICLLLTALFACMIWLRVLAVTEGAGSLKAGPDLDDEALPVYSVLVPVFRETSVLPQLIQALERLSYPHDKLDIKLILEETDTTLRRAVSALDLPSHMEVIVVPPAKPQTKPKALNYALPFARGELLTIYDAEDIPEPMQLRLAAAAFSHLPPDVACLQAELTFYNPNENWLTRQFTVEYATLFKLVLPALAKNGLPLPLGGTSNHFKTDVLRRVGGWDAYNVTEDADIGMRLARSGYRALCLDSLTSEEANTELRNWLNQRARWMKGFLQTWLVHMRNPTQLLRDVGLQGFLVVQAMLLGVVISATLYPVFFGLAIWHFGFSAFNTAEQSLVYLFLEGCYLGFLCLGSGIMIFSGAMAARRLHYPGWWSTIATMPFYWVLMSLAGWMALWQFIHAPFHWNKTRHGLSQLQKQKAVKG